MKIQNPAGLTFNFLENGSVKSIEADPIRISLKSANLFSRSGMNLYLRKRSKTVGFNALLGAESNSRFMVKDNVFMAGGSWDGLDYKCILRLSKTGMSWQWSVEVTNASGVAVELDTVFFQDIGLKPVNSGLMNEYYVSQYLERRILEHPEFGAVLCCRQNMKELTGHPWLMLACGNGAVAGCTDGMQFFGTAFRQTGIPESLKADRLGGEYAGESSVVALQEYPYHLPAGGSHRSIFIATYLPDHPRATAEEDLRRLPEILAELENGMSSQDGFSEEMSSHTAIAVKNLFNTAPFLPVEDITASELIRLFGRERRHPESLRGRFLSFFYGNGNHVALREKEVLADRPHAHIMQACTHFAPNENILSTTSFAFGVFNSHVSQGNTNFNVLLSICTSQFNQSPESGQRIFVNIDDKYYLLGVPSAFEMGLNHCRWIYKHGDRCFQVRTWTSPSAPQVNMDFKVLQGNPVGLMITHSFDPLNEWSVIPGTSASESVAVPGPGSMISARFPRAQFRIIVQNSGADYRICSEDDLFPANASPGNSLFVLKVGKTGDFCMSFVGEVCERKKEVGIENPDIQFEADCQEAWSSWKDFSMDLTLKGDQADVAAIREILPWYGLNALTHFLTPYGLEQFSGAAWGTRDVSQGPIDLLLTLEKFAEARKVMLTIFSNQNPDGGWPQWWMFDSYREIRAGDSHGDVFYWCLIALGSYIKVTGDLKILDEILPYYHPEGTVHAEKTPLGEHVDRLINMIIDSFIPGTSLVPFGGGDWNDSLQPVSRDLAQRMISSWTVEMNYQAFSQYKQVMIRIGNMEKAEELGIICQNIKSDFNKYLVKDGIVAGYGLVEGPERISVLLHPDDHITGIHYSILPMERGILSGIFTREQALIHLDLIEQHLKGPDGARLMDRPLKYRGGIQEIFQRAESSTFFGREIGLMYVHEHIRYAESLAFTGKADAFMKALRQAIPVGYQDVVPCGDIRQSNCYYSSSDVAFKTRYEADERYEDVIGGKFPLKGGWRVYSSGPGIYISLIVQRLLGLRIGSRRIIIDPVMISSMDGLSARFLVRGHAVAFCYSVKDAAFGPKAISINGIPVHFEREENKFRLGGAAIQLGEFVKMLDREENTVEVMM